MAVTLPWMSSKSWPVLADGFVPFHTGILCPAQCPQPELGRVAHDCVDRRARVEVGGVAVLVVMEGARIPVAPEGNPVEFRAQVFRSKATFTLACRVPPFPQEMDPAKCTVGNQEIICSRAARPPRC